MNLVNYAEKGFVPIWLIRCGIRHRLSKRLELEANTPLKRKEALIEVLKNSPIALATEAANEQHYELPASFFELFMGKHMKYSSGYWPKDNMSLDESELAALELVAQRAGISDNMNVLELGCGWGSFSLWAAEKFKNSHFTAVSNSHSQAEHIRTKAKARKIENLEVITADMNDFEANSTYDRIVSIEMFEHMRNYEKFFAKIATWLKKDARLFVHIFSHKKYAYTYESEDDNEWMANYFFTGGIMPSHDLFSHFDKDLKIENRWQLNGHHYHKTLETWFKYFNDNITEIRKIFDETYGEDNSSIWIWRWRLFFLACSELFALNQCEEYGVSHYIFKKS